jgi:hypothetical protein
MGRRRRLPRTWQRQVRVRQPWASFIDTQTPQGIQFAGGKFMRIPRLPFLALLLSVCVAPIAAQSSPDKTPAFSHSRRDELVAAPEFRARSVQPVQPTPNWRIRVRDTDPQQRVLPSDSTLTQNDTVCYSIRSYRVTRDDRESDATRLAGYSECQPAARYQVKVAVDSR